jgi:hypothetical protein
MNRFSVIATLLVTTILSGCATEDSPPIRRVSAQEFMRPHTFKGLPTDQFIGITQTGLNRSRDRKPDKAFKQIWSTSLFSSWSVIWCPAEELPEDYIRTASTEPNRPAHRTEALNEEDRRTRRIVQPLPAVQFR